MSPLLPILAALVCSLLPAWFTVRLVDRYRDRFPAFLIAFVAQFVMAVAAAWLAGVGFDVVGVPMYAPAPKPGNFTLPIPWTFSLPAVQAATFGPITGVAAGVWAKRRGANARAQSE